MIYKKEEILLHYFFKVIYIFYILFYLYIYNKEENLEKSTENIKEIENQNIEEIGNEDREKLQKIHEKMLEDDLNGVESKLTKQFLSDSKFIQEQLENESPKASSVPKKIKTKKPPEGVLPHKFKIIK